MTADPNTADRLLDDLRAWECGNLSNPAPREVYSQRLAGQAADKIERLRNGIQAMLDGNYPHPRFYRPAGCPHGQPYYEECELCNEDWLRRLLAGSE